MYMTIEYILLLSCFVVLIKPHLRNHKDQQFYDASGGHGNDQQTYHQVVANHPNVFDSSNENGSGREIIPQVKNIQHVEDNNLIETPKKQSEHNKKQDPKSMQASKKQTWRKPFDFHGSILARFKEHWQDTEKDNKANFSDDYEEDRKFDDKKGRHQSDHDADGDDALESVAFKAHKPRKGESLSSAMNAPKKIYPSEEAISAGDSSYKPSTKVHDDASTRHDDPVVEKAKEEQKAAEEKKKKEKKEKKKKEKKSANEKQKHAASTNKKQSQMSYKATKTINDDDESPDDAPETPAFKGPAHKPGELRWDEEMPAKTSNITDDEPTVDKSSLTNTTAVAPAVAPVAAVPAIPAVAAVPATPKAEDAIIQVPVGAQVPAADDAQKDATTESAYSSIKPTDGIAVPAKEPAVDPPLPTVPENPNGKDTLGGENNPAVSDANAPETRKGLRPPDSWYKKMDPDDRKHHAFHENLMDHSIMDGPNMFKNIEPPHEGIEKFGNKDEEIDINDRTHQADVNLADIEKNLQGPKNELPGQDGVQVGKLDHLDNSYNREHKHQDETNDRRPAEYQHERDNDEHAPDYEPDEDVKPVRDSHEQNHDDRSTEPIVPEERPRHNDHAPHHSHDHEDDDVPGYSDLGKKPEYPNMLDRDSDELHDDRDHADPDDLKVGYKHEERNRDNRNHYDDRSNNHGDYDDDDDDDDRLGDREEIADDRERHNHNDLERDEYNDDIRPKHHENIDEIRMKQHDADHYTRYPVRHEKPLPSQDSANSRYTERDPNKHLMKHFNYETGEIDDPAGAGEAIASAIETKTNSPYAMFQSNADNIADPKDTPRVRPRERLNNLASLKQRPYHPSLPLKPEDDTSLPNQYHQRDSKASNSIANSDMPLHQETQRQLVGANQYNPTSTEAVRQDGKENAKSLDSPANLFKDAKYEEAPKSSEQAEELINQMQEIALKNQKLLDSNEGMPNNQNNFGADNQDLPKELPSQFTNPISPSPLSAGKKNTIQHSHFTNNRILNKRRKKRNQMKLKKKKKINKTFQKKQLTVNDVLQNTHQINFQVKSNPNNLNNIHASKKDTGAVNTTVTIDIHGHNRNNAAKKTLPVNKKTKANNNVKTSNNNLIVEIPNNGSHKIIKISSKKNNKTKFSNTINASKSNKRKAFKAVSKNKNKGKSKTLSGPASGERRNNIKGFNSISIESFYSPHSRNLHPKEVPVKHTERSKDLILNSFFSKASRKSKNSNKNSRINFHYSS